MKVGCRVYVAGRNGVLFSDGNCGGWVVGWLPRSISKPQARTARLITTAIVIFLDLESVFNFYSLYQSIVFSM